MTFCSKTIYGLLVATVVAGFADGAFAQRPRPGQPPAPSPAQAQPAPAAAPNANLVDNSGTATVNGFRSAKFGMTEAEVRTAIQSDFRVKPEDIKVEENSTEQTRVLTARVPDLLQGGGTADLAYVLGYKTKKLIQVSVAWSKQTDDQLTAERLFSNANILRAHFVSAGYKPDSIVTNGVVNNGLIMFRGSDAADRTTLLLLQGTTTAGENQQRILTPTGLLLFYLADAKNPDVFRLPPGQF